MPAAVSHCDIHLYISAIFFLPEKLIFMSSLTSPLINPVSSAVPPDQYGHHSQQSKDQSFQLFNLNLVLLYIKHREQHHKKFELT